MPKYVYKDGEWNKHGKIPAPNLGRGDRFRDASSADAHKIGLGEGWVVFTSPSRSVYRFKKSDQW